MEPRYQDRSPFAGEAYRIARERGADPDELRVIELQLRREAFLRAIQPMLAEKARLINLSPPAWRIISTPKGVSIERLEHRPADGLAAIDEMIDATRRRYLPDQA